MRLSEFWARMEAQLGPAYAESYARDHVLTALGERTVREALEAGETPQKVWRAVAADQEVPEHPPERPAG